MNRLCLLILLFSGLSGLACGLKGTPVPPQALVPQSIENLQAVPRKGTVILTWAVPYKRKDGSQMEDLLGFEVFRKELKPEEFREGQEEATEDESDGLTDNQKELLGTLERGPRFRREGNQLWEGKKRGESPYTFIARIVLDDPSPARLEDDIVTLIDEGKDLPSGFIYHQRYRYLALSFNRNGYFGELSNRAEALIIPPPRSPADLVALKGNGEVSLYWQSTTENVDGTTLTDLKGFNIYRSTIPGQYPSTPINSRLIEKNSFQDGGLQNNQKYYYVVRSIVGNPLTGNESTPSNEVEAIPTDQTSPAPPQGLLGVRGEGFINLTWEVNREADLQGYHLYRSTTSGSGYRRLTSTPIPHTTYIDQGALAKQTYYYVVTSVDNASPPNESTFSVEVKISRR